MSAENDQPKRGVRKPRATGSAQDRTARKPLSGLAQAADSGKGGRSSGSADKPVKRAAKPVETDRSRAADSVSEKPVAADSGAAASKKKPAVKETAPRQAAARARGVVRSDTRTTTRRKPAAPKVAAPEAAAPEVESVQPAPGLAAPETTQPPQEAPALSGSAAFMEAAFGENSRLPEQLLSNIDRIDALTQRLVAAVAQRRPKNPGVEGPGADLYTTAATAWMKLLTGQPELVMSRQVSYWGETLRHFAEAQAALATGTLRAPKDEGPKDRRFSNPLWESHPFFNFVKRQYQINADAMHKAAADLGIDDTIDRRRVEWFTRQMIDMMAPTNFLATNPDALEKAVATEGESLVLGLENLVRDVEKSGGEFMVSLADPDAFRVGEDIGTTEGTVVARTRLFELIQYKPTTETVHEIPLVIFPPWINKFYIMDLKPKNSLIRWIVDQGYTLFVVSWRNPGPEMGDTGMDDYVSAYLDVTNRVLDLTDQPRLNVVGYCIAGTTLALTASLLKQRGDDRINSATFFTTLTDFSDQGEFTAFLQDDFVSGIEAEVGQTGILSSQLMSRTFSFLRANDLVWAPAIRSYMLGERPPAFDLLFWNGDGTNLPGRMAREYLRGLCQKNAFSSGEFEIFGHKLNVGDVTVPLCAIACDTDHIAPARDSWRGIAQMGSKDKTFILSESGHIAGIINPPSKKKYGHFTSDGGFAKGFDHWRESANFHEGSWWPRWQEWLSGRSGAQVGPRDPGEGLGPAPGTYVTEKV